MNYQGLVFTDALNMQAVAEYYPPGVVDAKALLAGNDVMLNTMDVRATIREVKAAIERDEITMEEIENRARKVLKAKKGMGLDQWNPIDTKAQSNERNNDVKRREAGAKSPESQEMDRPRPVDSDRYQGSEQ